MMLHWQMIFYLVTGFVLGIVVSLLTRPRSEEKLRQFYELVRTPVNTAEGQPDEPCTIPAGVAVPAKRLMLQAGGLEILRPSASAVIGFVVCWAAVGAMILGFYLLTR